MSDETERRIRHLEERLQNLEQQLFNDRAKAERVRQRERWARLTLFGLAALAYVVYLKFLGSL